MPRLIRPALFLAVSTMLAVAAGLTSSDAEGRLRQALQIARERNEPALVAEVESTGKRVLAGLQTNPSDAALDAQLRALESKVGLDPGGWSMAGQPLFHPTPAMLAQSKELGPRLVAAMHTDDPAQVRAITAEMRAILGDQAGVPDGRRRGAHPVPHPITAAEATQLFFRALDGEAARLRPLLDGRPAPDQMLRFYAYLLDATTTIRPLAAVHEPARLAELDRLAHSLAKILTALQQPAGHFPFPDLRGKNIRFGAMTDRQLATGRAEVRDGWIVSPDPDGGSQFDTGVCGVALIRAGQLHGEPAWLRAGLHAAEWALGEPCCGNFNYNAFSVSLLAHAFGATQEARYLAGALRKFRVGVAPGQAPNGRWLDAHNARTVYHLIILRALGDLAAVLPAGWTDERAEVASVAQPAVRALLDEFDAMGHTVEALPEMQALVALFPTDSRLRDATSLMAGGLVAKCTDGRRVKLGVAPHQLAAVARALPPIAPTAVTADVPPKKLPLPGEVFFVAGRPAFLIPAPSAVTEKSKPWIWYAPTLEKYPGPEEQWMFAQFLAAGIAIAGIDAGESYGSPAGRKLFSALHSEMTQARGFSPRPVLLGRSRGGLMLLSWAAENPEKVAAFAGIYPVCNLASYPGVAKAARAYELAADQLAARLAEYNPIDRLAPIAAARIPLFAIHGDADKVVPLAANSALMRERYVALGGPMELIIPPGQGHNMWDGFFQCAELVAFVKTNARR